MNKGLGIVLAILVGITAGMCFLLSINSVVHQSMLPLGADLRSINGDLTSIKSSLASGAGNNQVLDRLTVIERRLKNIEDKMTAAPAGEPTAKQQMPPSEDYNKFYSIEVGKSYVKGKKDAPVTIVAFTDFQCPFCSRFHTPFQEALKAYSGKANFIIKNYPLPFHPFAKPAAKVALAAGEQGKYFEMADILLENQQKLNDEGYKELAKKVGLNVDKLMKDLKDKDAEYEEILDKDTQLASTVDVRGTPTFFINGKKTMARDVESIKAAIEKELAAKGGK
jgi:protein-disulfide isomerase